MPGRDGSGPNGMGARTGRGLGVCTGVDAPAYGRGFGLGFGRGFGAGYGMGGGRRACGGLGLGLGFRGGRGMGGGWAAPSPRAAFPDSRELLEERAAFLENELRAVRERMEALKDECSE